MKKILSLALSALLLVSMIPTAMAFDRELLETPCDICGDPALCAGCQTCISCDGPYCDCFPAPVSHESGTQVEYVARNDEWYEIQVPAILKLDINGEASGEVDVYGDFSSKRFVAVTVPETVTLINSLNSDETMIAKIDFDEMYVEGSNFYTTGPIARGDISLQLQGEPAFGTWSGIFYYNVEIGDVA